MKGFTKKWWQNCLKDPLKLNAWLISLYNVELNACDRFKFFAFKYCKEDKESFEIFSTIAKEELNHSTLVAEVLMNREIPVVKFEEEKSKYFSVTNSCINSKESAAAIGAYAETLSLYRMRVIIADKNTPEDIRKMFEIIEPEEANHAKLLRQVATKYGMKAVLDCHHEGLEKLGIKITKSK